MPFILHSMTSYLRKYVTAIASARDYVAQWSSEHVYANEELIVPFPTIARFNPEKRAWIVNIKAWVYLPFQPKSLTSYLPSLPTILTGRKAADAAKKLAESSDDTESNKTKKTVFNEEDENQITTEPQGATREKVDADKKQAAALANEENEKAKKADETSGEEEGSSDDDIYQDALEGELGEPVENPGRLGLFFVGSSVKVATKSIINGVEHLLQPTDESGFIEEYLELPDEEVISHCTRTHDECKDRKFEYQIQLNIDPKKHDIKKGDIPEDGYKTFKCIIYVLARHGLSVISDIDDTVKISNVVSKRSLLKHTFYSYFKAVEGINEVYQKWSEQKCQFHYVSASPWQLYPALRCFFEKYKFPHGTVNLRRFNWNLKFFSPADTYKLETISEIIDAYPLRHYICVGDSGELDPEIYSKLYEKYPSAIVHIFIRDICSAPQCLPTCEERYKKAFEKVPKERWTIFKDPKDIETDVNKLLAVQNV